jgi:hypothetical protein
VIRLSGLLLLLTGVVVDEDDASQVQANAGAEGEREEEDGERERPDPPYLFSVLVVHTRSLLKFLNAHAVSKTTIACKQSVSSSYPLVTNLGLAGICLSHPFCVYRGLS